MSFQTHALHCMLISHGLLYMVMSKGLHVTDVYFTHVTGLCGVSGVGSTGAMGANTTILLSQGPCEASLYIGHADKVRERVNRGEGGREGKEEGVGGGGGGGGEWVNGEDILCTTVSFSGVVCRHVHRSVSPT